MTDPQPQPELEPAGGAGAMAAGGEFVEGWLVAQVLGEGAYGEVRLLVHARTGAAVALKVVRGAVGAVGAEAAGSGAGAECAREAALHRALRHRHVLRCLGERTHQGLHYMFLEYAQGGELFDRIEPDVGMCEVSARRYWRQLLAGLQYLHARGVAHRDIKPENLLLDHRDQIKISDFGMATLFRHGSRERLLSRVCGTVPYAAPEVLAAARRAYRAPPADLWAAALVLLAMLAGELPWERAAAEDARYAAWCAGEVAAAAAERGPWRKLSAAALALLRRALLPDARRRAELRVLLDHAWMRDAHEGGSRAWRSQPAAGGAGGTGGGGGGGGGGEGGVGAGVGGEGGDTRPLSAADMDALLSYSQPAHADDLLLATPADAPPHGVLQRLVRRMTRVWVRCDADEALRALCEAAGRRGYACRRLHDRILAIECGEEVRLRACALSCAAAAAAGVGDAARTLLEFRRSRGCGLQFKRRYVELRDALAPLAAPPPPPLPLHTPRYVEDADVEML